MCEELETMEMIKEDHNELQGVEIFNIVEKFESFEEIEEIVTASWGGTISCCHNRPR